MYVGSPAVTEIVAARTSIDAAGVVEARSFILETPILFPWDRRVQVAQTAESAAKVEGQVEGSEIKDALNPALVQRETRPPESGPRNRAHARGM